MIERVMLLDAVLDDRELTWLGPSMDKRRHFIRHLGDRLDTGLPTLAVRRWPREDGALLPRQAADRDAVAPRHPRLRLPRDAFLAEPMFVDVRRRARDWRADRPGQTRLMRYAPEPLCVRMPASQPTQPIYRLPSVSPSPRLSAVIAITSSNEPTAPLQCGSESQPDRRS